jgi:hypothetical protein
MRDIVSEKRATEMVQEAIGEVLVQAAYAKNAPPGTIVEVAGETFVVTDDGKLRGTERKPYVTTASVRRPADP